MKCTITTTSGTLSIRTGTEGCNHDPWGYTEYVWAKNNGATVKLRCGIAVRMCGHQPEIEFAQTDDEEIAMCKSFWDIVGMTANTADRAMKRLRKGDYAPDPFDGHDPFYGHA